MDAGSAGGPSVIGPTLASVTNLSLCYISATVESLSGCSHTRRMQGGRSEGGHAALTGSAVFRGVSQIAMFLCHLGPSLLHRSLGVTSCSTLVPDMSVGCRETSLDARHDNLPSGYLSRLTVWSLLRFLRYDEGWCPRTPPSRTARIPDGLRGLGKLKWVVASVCFVRLRAIYIQPKRVIVNEQSLLRGKAVFTR